MDRRSTPSRSSARARTGPTAAITVLNDITEHKEAELALARSEELKGAIMAASLDAILTLTRDGEIVDLNQRRGAALQR